MDRTTKSIRNIKYAVMGQTVGTVISFINRMIFIRFLSIEYLGINGVFRNIIEVISIAELGIEATISYLLYKPLAENDEAKIKTIMHVYKRMYFVIGIIVSALALAITPFLGFFVNEMPNIPNIKLIYLIIISTSVLPYFSSYKRTLIISDQKGYLSTLYQYEFFVVYNIIQIIILVLTKNYILYIAVQVIGILGGNIAISNKANKIYPILKEKDIQRLELNDKKFVVKNVKAMVWHKIGSALIYGTDNILLAKYISITAAGIYSNYLLIISALDGMFMNIYGSLISSVGNLNATESEEKSKFIFDCIDLLSFWVIGFSSICLYILFNPFIGLWLGADYLFEMKIVSIIVVNFYLNGRRRCLLTFRNALGLFWNDRYKTILEASVNLSMSVFLIKTIGTPGVFIGTTIGIISTSFWIEPYILFKYGFKRSTRSYFIRYSLYTIVMLATGYMTYLLSSLLFANTFYGFIGKVAACILIVNIFFTIVFWKTKEFQYIWNLFKYKFNKINEKILRLKY